MIRKALVVLSGGQDSTTCLFLARTQYDEVYTVTYDYGQRHAVELESAAKVAQLAGVKEHVVVKLGSVLQGSSPLVSNELLEQYPDMYSLPGGLEKTFVPGRNLLFFTLAANHAHARGIVDIISGVCQEDSGGYPDCRAEFVDATQQAIRLGLGYDDNDLFRTHFRIITPLMYLTKAESVKLAWSIPGCWDALAYSHTAYDGAYPPIGNDHATLLRAKGFLEAGFPDPLVVRAVRTGLMQYPETPNYERSRDVKDTKIDTQA